MRERIVTVLTHHFFALVAQWTEFLDSTQSVAGSIPAEGSKIDQASIRPGCTSAACSRKGNMGDIFVADANAGSGGYVANASVSSVCW
jgi:hypothetical protein